MPRNLARNRLAFGLALGWMVALLALGGLSWAEDSTASDKGAVSATLRKRELGDDTVPALETILRLSPPGTGGEHIDLGDVLEAAREKDFTVRAAKEQREQARREAKNFRVANVWNLLNPVSWVDLKQAAESHAQAADARYRAAIQKSVLENARRYDQLLEAYLGRQLAFQNLDQGRRTLKAAQERFLSGETDRFEVTRAEMAMLEAYQRYLAADTRYRETSTTLAAALGWEDDEWLIPQTNVAAAEGPLVVTGTDQAVEQALANQPELQELAHRRDALAHLVQATGGAERDKRKAELRELEIRLEQARQATRAAADQAYRAFVLADENMLLSSQRLQLAERLLHQLQVSQEAGFSSVQDVQNGELVLESARAERARAVQDYNISRLQLFAALGLLAPADDEE